MSVCLFVCPVVYLFDWLSVFVVFLCLFVCVFVWSRVCLCLLLFSFLCFLIIYVPINVKVLRNYNAKGCQICAGNPLPNQLVQTKICKICAGS